jgi:disulfide bond formation protein DsbB
MQRILFAVAIALGLLIGYVDSRPSWDDTGVTAGVLFISTAILGALAPQRPWVWALCVGLWIPLFGIFGSSNYGSLIALAVAFVGAYSGMLLRRTFIPA